MSAKAVYVLQQILYLPKTNFWLRPESKHNNWSEDDIIYVQTSDYNNTEGDNTNQLC